MSSQQVPSKRPRLGAPEDSIFSVPCAVQQASNDLVIYSAAAGQCVTVAWPTYNSGIKVKPSDFKEYLTMRGVHVECFCKAKHADSKLCFPSKILKVPSKVVAVCHDEPSTCGFYLDLTRIYQRTKLTSKYQNLRPSADGGPFPMRKDAEQLVELRLRCELNGNTEVAPYFKGFLGDIVPGVGHWMSGGEHRPSYSSARTQVRQGPSRSSAGAFLSSSPSPSPSPSKSCPTGLSSLGAQVGSSGMQGGYDCNKSKLKAQQELLEEAIEGEGILTKVWEDLFEHCSVCNKTFLQAYFKAHQSPCFITLAGILSDEGDNAEEE